MDPTDNRELESLAPEDLLNMGGKTEDRVRDDSEVSGLGNSED